MLNLKILFCDDDFLCNLDTCEILRGGGFVVMTTYCASAAFEIIAKHEHLSALVTDIDLGPGADGFEIGRRARTAYPNLPVVYISGSAVARHALEGVEASTFLSKPYEPRQLIAALKRAIRLEAA